jgi:hypothetical protein
VRIFFFSFWLSQSLFSKGAVEGNGEGRASTHQLLNQIITGAVSIEQVKVLCT